MPGTIKIGITYGLRGHFAVMYDEDGPIQTGFTCKDAKEARRDAIDWAKAEFGDAWQQHCDCKEGE